MSGLVDGGRTPAPPVMTKAPQVKEADDTTFEAEVLQGDVPVLVCFTAHKGAVGDVTLKIARAVAGARRGSLKVVVVDMDQG